MTRENIIRMAREAGLHIATDVSWMPIIGLEYAEKFAVLVAAHEREECAKVCENYTDNGGEKFADHEGHGYECATAIRARGEQ